MPSPLAYNKDKNEEKPGRMVVCSNCARTTAQGTTQVHRKVVFHFCPVCWGSFRLDCRSWMQRVCGGEQGTSKAA